jgi:hypothetical protein
MNSLTYRYTLDGAPFYAVIETEWENDETHVTGYAIFPGEPQLLQDGRYAKFPDPWTQIAFIEGEREALDNPEGEHFPSEIEVRFAIRAQATGDVVQWTPAHQRQFDRMLLESDIESRRREVQHAHRSVTTTHAAIATAEQRARDHHEQAKQWLQQSEGRLAAAQEKLAALDATPVA